MDTTQELDFNDFSNLFNPEDWDVGYLSRDNFKRCCYSALKVPGGYGDFAKNYSNSLYYPEISNAFVLIRKGHTWDYTLYGEATQILKDANMDDCELVFTHYKEAAILSGLGVRARNSLIYSYKFGFDAHIVVAKTNRTIVNFPTNKRINYRLWERCNGCDDCAKACPVGAIHNEGDNPLSYWIDSDKCVSFICWGNHDRIPTIKDFWHKNVHPEIDENIIKEIETYEDAARKLGFTEPTWDNNGYTYDKQIVYKDGEPIDVPVCRECTSQPRCSKYNGRYPYEDIGERKVVKFYKAVK